MVLIEGKPIKWGSEGGREYYLTQETAGLCTAVELIESHTFTSQLRVPTTTTSALTPSSLGVVAPGDRHDLE
jgi:hypothetical protein